MNLNLMKLACSCLALIGLTSTATASEYYRRITPEELKKERPQKKCEFVWSEVLYYFQDSMGKCAVLRHSLICSDI